MYLGVKLIEDMAGHFPEVEESYACHVENFDGEVLPHVFLWDLIGEIVESSLVEDDWLVAWGPVLDFLEARATEGDTEDINVISHSFLLSLPYPDSPGYSIINHLGPSLAQRLSQIRPSG
ncbi:hypothetical protein [Nocardia sp. NPDC052112]|uniref:hypothetical protein n=1 Tax=Nocardia sp. NPDC052112 TaxID=3155646 RepID=UPI003436A714